MAKSKTITLPKHGEACHHIPYRKISEYIQDPHLLEGPPVVGAVSDSRVQELLVLLRRIDRPILNYTHIDWASLGQARHKWSKAYPGWLDASLKHDFDDPTPILSAVTTVGDPSSLVERHIAVLCELCNFHPNSELFTKLCVVHTYLCTYFNLLDSYFDRHAPSEHAILEGGPLLAAMYDHLYRLTSIHSPTSFGVLASKLKGSLLMQRNSLLAEARFQNLPLVSAEVEEKQSIVGRANCVFLTVDLISILANRPVSGNIRRGLEDYLYLSQLADDFGDWRQDFRRQNYSSFLRDCFDSLGYVPDEGTLEKTVLLDGRYEMRLVEVIRRLDALITDYGEAAHRLPLTRNVILGERKKLLTILNDFVEAKRCFHNNITATA